jgi:cytochrome c oxidase accessory protein FixG
LNKDLSGVNAGASSQGGSNGSGVKVDVQFDQDLYAKRKKIFPRQVHGLFARLRVIGVSLLMGIYYGVPWLMWDGRQAVLWDLPNRKFHIFGATFWPQDFIYLSAFLIIAALSLFFFTALAGRLWCGYACPQTVWTEVFLWIERKVEGDRGRQIKLDKSEWNSNKLIRKGIKHFLWVVLSLWTGYTFVGYFAPVRELGVAVLEFSTGPWETFWILFYGFATYGNAGWLREQVCMYMCPYARFQSAMFDPDTLIISYDKDRGEPRGARKKSADPAAVGLGSCINCTICVQVCPTGIDIRDGLQYECIGCAACIDACDDVMDKIGYEPGLIRYTTENRLEGRPGKILRPRIAIYGIILVVLLVGAIYGIYQRSPLGLDVIRDRNTLYREPGDGLVENVYTLKIINKDNAAHTFSLKIDSEFPFKLLLDSDEIKVSAGEVGELTVRARIDPYVLKTQSVELHFVLSNLEQPDIVATEPARFIGPVN